MAASGFLRPLLDDDNHSSVDSLDQKLEHLGLNHEQRVNLEETLLENRVAVAVESPDKSELPTVLQVLQRAGAEKMFVAQLAPTGTPSPRTSKSGLRVAA